MWFSGRADSVADSLVKYSAANYLDMNGSDSVYGQPRWRPQPRAYREELGPGCDGKITTALDQKAQRYV
ncbi:hypothetical protein N7520_010119 [Penicillium odoratum]|uniref:uncharacterized protein n=1 Tax=Penicillium odoratum TaxID=1167516 RepID=UPI002546E0CC|nr:uncharacterized protein N7520_010119 [Penicillium odoratum]KAJ5753202.1 hypothetical protein N7520_010119 [Penicillium odoratum]